MGEPLVLLLALGLDALIGDPDWLWRRLPHPVVLFGRLIDGMDRRWNREGLARNQLRRRGLLAVVLLVTASLALGLALERAFAAMGAPGFLAEAILVAILVAQRSLAEHVGRVATGLRAGLGEGRRAVAMIVGRDPERLDRAGVARAAIESLAENAGDGVVAPVLAYALLGLPGVIALKAINTADSMIGHMTDRHREFGRAAALLDDAVMRLPARLTALLVMLAAPRRARRIGALARLDAPRHRSPNAGWPEAAFAAALGLALGGPRSYGGGVLSEPVLNAGGRGDAGEGDIRAAVALFARLCLVQAALVGLLALL